MRRAGFIETIIEYQYSYRVMGLCIINYGILISTTIIRAIHIGCIKKYFPNMKRVIQYSIINWMIENAMMNVLVVYFVFNEIHAYGMARIMSFPYYVKNAMSIYIAAIVIFCFLIYKINNILLKNKKLAIINIVIIIPIEIALALIIVYVIGIVFADPIGH